MHVCVCVCIREGVCVCLHEHSQRTTCESYFSLEISVIYLWLFCYDEIFLHVPNHVSLKVNSINNVIVKILL